MLLKGRVYTLTRVTNPTPYHAAPLAKVVDTSTHPLPAKRTRTPPCPFHTPGGCPWFPPGHNNVSELITRLTELLITRQNGSRPRFIELEGLLILTPSYCPKFKAIQLLR